MEGSRIYSKAMIVLIALISCFMNTEVIAASKKPFKGTLRIPVTRAIQTSDPVAIETSTEWTVANQVHQPLFWLDPSGEVQPALAQDLPKVSSNRRELTIRLKPGLTFHDGSPIDSKAVLASWERLLRKDSESEHWWLLSAIKGAVDFRRGKLTRLSGVERINDLTFRVRLIFPLPGFMAALATIPTAPISSRWMARAGESDRHPPGGGAFLHEPAPSRSVFGLLPFAKHWRGRPYLEKVELKSYDSARAANLAFELNEVQIGSTRPSRRAEEFNLVRGPTNRIVFLVINRKRLAQKELGFKAAVEKAIDRKSLADYLVGDRGVASDEIISIPKSSVESKVPAVDPKGARKFFQKLTLKRMGVPPSLEFIVRKGNQFDRAAAERIQVNMVDVGVSVYIVELGPKAFRERLKKHEYDFYLMRPLSLVSDPELQLLAVAARAGGEDEVSSLLESLAALPLNDSREGMIRERARRYQLKTSWIPLLVHCERVYSKSKIRDYKPGLTGLVDLADVWFAE